MSDSTTTDNEAVIHGSTDVVDIFGVRLDLISAGVLSDLIEDAGKQQAHTTIVYSHFEILMDAAKDDDLRAYLNSSTINHIDGIGVWFAVKFLHRLNPLRFTGSDFLEPWLADVLSRNRRVFILGGSHRVSDHLQRLLDQRYGEGRVFCRHGEIDLEDTSIAQTINAKNPDIVLASLGSRFQYSWLRRHRDSLAAPVVIATGGFVNFLARTRPRAPRWMRAMGMEWLHRLVLEPGRLWRRYFLGIPTFLFLIGRERLRRAAAGT